jgi:branched-chain amino acid transport system substrate-binding protein
MRWVLSGFLGGVLAVAASVALAQGKPPLKLGGILDMSGLYADITGAGSETAAKMAAEDFGGEVLGRKIEIIAADHLNKADLSANIARDMLDNQGVEMIFDVAASATALAAGEIAKARNKIIMFNGPGSIRLSNEACGPYTVHYVFDTFAQANVTGLAAVKQGLDTWFFITVDYAFGQDLEKDTANVVLKSGGKVLGNVRHPLNSSDFSSYLLQAQNSGADIVGLANAGGDLNTCIKQAAEFGVTKTQRLAGLILNVTNIPALGLEAVQNSTICTGFYWDMNDGTRAFAKRFQAAHPKQMMPNDMHAGMYSATAHLIKAMAVTKSASDGVKLVDQMKAMPTDDPLFGQGSIRVDGRKLHPMYLLATKTVAESKGDWDYFKVLATIKPEDAFRSLEQGGCPFVKA